MRDFLAWAEGQRLDLIRITPGDVGSYLRALPWSVPTEATASALGSSSIGS